ncbi:MAG: hypothetical protein GYB65_17875 [Chloroflexi bacterium]|nr:hypothetical protein [Chloroflexota bacterium]
MTPSPTTAPSTTRPWPTGIATLIGIALGALVGVFVGLVPVTMTAGLALGVGLDSILNYTVNGVRVKPPADDAAESDAGESDGD